MKAALIRGAVTLFAIAGTSINLFQLVIRTFCGLAVVALGISEIRIFERFALKLMEANLNYQRIFFDLDH